MKHLFKLLMIFMTVTLLGACSNQESAKGGASSTTKQELTKTAQVQQFNIQQFEPVVKPMFANQAFKSAWLDYKNLIDKVEFNYLPTPKAKGSSIKRVDSLKLLRGKAIEKKLGKDSLVKIYTYTTKDPFNKKISKEPGSAQIALFYEKNQLIFAGVYNNSALFKEKNLLDQNVVKSLVKKPFDFKQLKTKEVIVSGFGTTVVNNHAYGVISMPSGDIKNPTMEYFAIVKGKLDYITTKAMAEAAKNEISFTIEAMNDYLVNDSNEFYKIHKNESETNKDKMEKEDTKKDKNKSDDSATNKD
ncbi:hypothetical protein [Vaginisenegalia massiliensis]|uniref:hypothetical protein n=1 Tax=Vaginisenegalia massiliensis TaxID=2058294 RepID=UPI000F52707F|nr:hypothetical protein [Vaginisenegalia massiliensis]